MTSCGEASTQMTDPDYIKFLLNPDLPYEYYFEVGNEKLAPVEKIGVVCKMLSAHSEVFRAQFQHSHLNEEKKIESITDTFPGTFRHLLRFVYGFDTTASMSFEDADNLLYVADRFIMPTLKSKLSTRLLYLLDYTNICSLLNNPACYTVLELNAEITRILQFQTDLVFASDHFLDCCSDAFIKILQQEKLNVTELEVWQAAVKWAKKKAEPADDGKSLRKELEKPLAHIRVCTLTIDEFCREVAPTNILNKAEVAEICVAHGTKEQPLTLAQVNNSITPRIATTKNLQYHKSDIKTTLVTYLGQTKETSFILTTSEKGIRLTGFLVAYQVPTQEFNFHVTLEPVEKASPIISKTCKGVLDGKHFIMVPFSSDDQEILPPFSQFKITLKCDERFFLFRVPSTVESNGKEITIKNKFEEICNSFGNGVAVIRYQTLTPISQTV